MDDRTPCFDRDSHVFFGGKYIPWNLPVVSQWNIPIVSGFEFWPWYIDTVGWRKPRCRGRLLCQRAMQALEICFLQNGFKWQKKPIILMIVLMIVLMGWLMKWVDHHEHRIILDQELVKSQGVQIPMDFRTRRLTWNEGYWPPGLGRPGDIFREISREMGGNHWIMGYILWLFVT